MAETSKTNGSLPNLHNVGQVISGLEQAWEGQSTGKQLIEVVGPENGDGERQDRMLNKVSRNISKELTV